MLAHSRTHPRLIVATWLATLSFAATAHAVPVVGFLETWPGTSTQGWGGQSNQTNPGAGGVGGAGDGYLEVSTPSATTSNLGTVSFGSEYNGDWVAAGVTQVRLRLKDVGADDPLEIHFSLGNGANFWHYDVTFLPPEQQWAEFVVDLSSAANWTRIIGAGTFAAALQAVDRVHLRHDLAPYVQMPDPLDGDFGLDHLLLTDGIAGVPPSGSPVSRPVALAAPVPNPSRGPVALMLEVFDAGPVRLEVVDASGRLVRRAELAAAQPGTRVWTWDGLDASGRPAPAGVYRVRATGPAGGTSRPLVRLE